MSKYTNSALTIKEFLIAEKVPEDQIGNRYTDLYVLRTPVNKMLLYAFLPESALRSMSTFTSQKGTGKYENQTWYEIPFGYSEYMLEKCSK